MNEASDRMAGEIPRSRRQYRASGLVDPLRWVPLAAVAAGVALAMGALLDLLFAFGLYYVFFVPILLSLPVLGAVFLLTAWGRNRNRWLGLLSGIGLGLLFYLAFFWVGMVRDLGTLGLQHPEILPNYVGWRMASQTIESTPGTGSDAPKEPGAVDKVFNWVFLLMEVGIVAGLGGMTGFGRARRAYCERCDAWMVQQTLAYPHGSAKALHQAMEAETLPEMLATLTPITPVQNTPATLLLCETCPACVTAGRAVALLSVKDTKQVSPMAGNRFTASMGRANFFQVPAKGAEIVAFEAAMGKEMTAGSTLITATEEDANALGGAPGGAGAGAAGTGRSDRLVERAAMPSELARDVDAADPSLASPAVHASATSPAVASPTPAAPGDALRIVDIPADVANQMLNKQAIIIRNILGLIPILVIFAAMGILALGAQFGVMGENAPTDSQPLYYILAFVVCGIGGLLLVAEFIRMAILGLQGYAYFVKRRKLVRAINSHRDPLVRPTDPGAIPIEIVPRQNWRVMLETADDMGYARLDDATRRILIEGDRRRYTIPYAAVQSLTCFTVPITQQSSQAMLVLQIQRGDGTLELPLYMDALDHRLSESKRLERTESYLQEWLQHLPHLQRIKVGGNAMTILGPPGPTGSPTPPDASPPPTSPTAS